MIHKPSKTPLRTPPRTRQREAERAKLCAVLQKGPKSKLAGAGARLASISAARSAADPIAKRSLTQVLASVFVDDRAQQYRVGQHVRVHHPWPAGARTPCLDANGRFACPSCSEPLQTSGVGSTCSGGVMDMECAQHGRCKIVIDCARDMGTRMMILPFGDRGDAWRPGFEPDTYEVKEVCLEGLKVQPAFVKKTPAQAAASERFVSYDMVVPGLFGW